MNLLTHHLVPIQVTQKKIEIQLHVIQKNNIQTDLAKTESDHDLAKTESDHNSLKLFNC